MKLLDGELIKSFPIKARAFIGICLGIFILMIGLTFLKYGGIWIKTGSSIDDAPVSVVMTGEAQSWPIMVPGAPSFILERME